MLKPEILQMLYRNYPLRKALIDVNNIKSERSYYYWLTRNSQKLTQYDNLQIISAYLKIEIADLVQPRQKTA